MADEGSDDTESGAPAGTGLRRWSRRTTVWAAGAAALLAATSAVAIVTTGGDAPASTPTQSAKSPAAAQQADALDAIVAPTAAVRQPIAKLVQQGKLPKASYAGDTGKVGVPKNAKAPKQAAAGTVPQFNAGPLTGSFSLVQMASLAMQAGCPAGQAATAAAIGAAESAGNPGAQGDISLMDGTWDWSEGLWQIRGLRAERNTGGLRDSVANADPAKNAAAMMAISSGCTDWTPWSTYNTGAYLSYLGLSKSAAAAVMKYRDRTGQLPPVGSGAATTAPVPVATGARSTPAKRTPGKTTMSKKPKPSTSRSSSSTKPEPKPSSTKNSPKPSSSASAKPSLPIKLPTSLPIKLPTKIPTKIPTTLPIKLPTKIPTTLPSLLPSLLPGLP